jgi:hypothetical protein
MKCIKSIKKDKKKENNKDNNSCNSLKRIDPRANLLDYQT